MSSDHKYALELQVRQLTTTKQALESGLAQATTGAKQSEAGVQALQLRITRLAAQAVPHAGDKAIPGRIQAAVETACTDAAKALARRWDEIKNLIATALRDVDPKLNETRRELRQIEEAELHARSSGGRDDQRGFSGTAGSGPYG